MPVLGPRSEDSRSLGAASEESRSLAGLPEATKVLGALAEVSGAPTPALPALYPSLGAGSLLLPGAGTIPSTSLLPGGYTAGTFPSLAATFPSAGTAPHAPVGVPLLTPAAEGSRSLTPLAEV